MTKEEALNHLREILFYEYLGNKETQAIIIAIKSLEGIQPMTDIRKINTVISKHIITVRLLKIDEHEKELRLEVYNNIKEEINYHLDYKYYNISNLLIWLITYRNLMINTYKQMKDKDYYVKAYMLEETLNEIMKLEREYIKEV